MSYKQGNLDNNRQKLQALVDQYEALDVYKEVDKEYLQDRIGIIADMTNKYAMGDLSDPGLTSALRRNLGQVLDDNVKNAVMSTRIFRAEEQEWAEKRTKEPEKYSELNHAYALQASKPWRESQAVGEIYRGGGGFREYINVEKIITDKLPEIAERFKWTYIQDEEGNAYFRIKGKYETVPREQVEAALNGMLDQKSIEQLKINAWGKYDSLPDQAIKQMYDAGINAQVTEYQSMASKLKSLNAAETNPQKKAQYEAQIKEFEAKAGAVKSNSFDRIGKQSAYTSLYMEEFKGNYLDAYSYGPRFVDSEINELDEATRDYELALKKEAREEEYAEKNYQLKLAQADAKARKSLGLPGGSDLTPGTKKSDAVDQPETAEGAAAYISRMEDQSIKGLQAVLKSQNVNQDDLSDPALMAVLKKGSAGRDKVSVKLKNGKQVTIDFTNKYISQAVDKFNTYVLSENRAKKEYFKGVDTMVSNAQFKLGTAIAKGGDVNPTSLPRYQEKLVVMPDGKYKVEKVNAKAGHYYANLLKKQQTGELTASEKATLDWYTHRHLLADPKIKKEDRQMIYSKIDKEYRQKATSGRELMTSNWYEEYKITNFGDTIRLRDHIAYGTISRLKEMGLQIPEGRDYVPADIEAVIETARSAYAGNKEAASRLPYLIKNFNRKVSALPDVDINTNDSARPDFYLSDFGRNDLEWSEEGFMWDRAFKQDLEKDIAGGFDLMRANIDKEYESLNMNPSKVTHILSEKQGGYFYEGVQQLTGKILGKGSIIDMVPVLDPTTGVPTGDYKARYKYKTKDKEGLEVWQDGDLGVLTKENLQRIGWESDLSGRSKYNASYGKYAPTISMGDASISSMRESEGGFDRYRRVRELAEMKYGTGLPFEQAGEVVNFIAQQDTQAATEAANMYRRAERGEYVFKLESNGSEWKHNIYDQGKLVYSDPLGRSELTDEEVQEMKMYSQLYNQEAFSKFIKEEMSIHLNKKALEQYPIQQ